MTAYLILAGFLLGTLVIGLWAGKDVRTMKDYVLANRELSTAVVTMSMLATCIGAAEIRYPNYIFRYGIVDMLQAVPYTITFLMIGFFIAPKMVYFQDCLTAGDLMQKLYGNTARTFTGAVNFVFSVLIISSQIRAVGYLNSHLLGLPAEQVILSVGMVIVIYTLLGGMRSVVYTDVLQFIAMVVVILFLTTVLVYQVGGLKALFTNLPAKKLTLISNPTLGYAVKGALFWGGPTLLLTPPVLMRMLMVQDKRQASNMFFSGAIINALLRIAFMLIGLSTVVYFSGFSSYIAVAKRSDNLITYVGSIVFADNGVMRIFLFIGLLFVLASTIDSFLHAAGVSFSLDLVKPFCERRGFRVNEFNWIKGAIFAIGSLSVLMGFLGRNLPLTAYGYYQAVVAMSTITLPLIVGIMGLKTSRVSFFTFSISLIFIWGLLTKFTGLDRYIIFFISMAIATLVYFISHYILNKGFATVHRTKHATGYSVRKPSWRGLASTLGSWVATPAGLAKVAQKKVYSYGSEPFLFSLFFVCASPVLMMSTSQPPYSIGIFALMYGIAISLCCGLMVQVLWPNSMKPFFDLYWFFTLCYCLPFAGTLFFLMNPQSHGSVVSLAVVLLVLIMCVDWQTFFMLSGLGMSFAIIAYRLFTGHFLPFTSFDVTWDLVVIIGSLLITGFFFSRRKELYSFTQLKKAKLYAGSIAHETNNYLGVSMFAGDVIKHALEHKKFKRLEGKDEYVIPKELYENLVFLGPHLSEGAKQSVDKVKMFMSALKEDILGAKKEKLSVRACVQEALKDTYFQDADVKKGLLLELSDDFKAQVAKSYFKHVLYNIVKNAFHHGGASQVKISLDKAEHKLVIRDNGKGISTDRLPYIFDLFYSGGGSSGIGLALVKVIIESFGAKVHVVSKGGKGSFTEFSVVFA